MTSEKRLVRSKTDKMIGGVCGGLGAYFNFDPTLIRLIFAALILFGAGSPILLYLLMWIIIPAADSPRAMIGMNEAVSEDEAPGENVPEPVVAARATETAFSPDATLETTLDATIEKTDETLVETA